MAYNPDLAMRIKHYMAARAQAVEEIHQSGGLMYTVDGVVRVRLTTSKLLCRINPADHAELTGLPGCQPWVYKSKTMADWVQVNAAGLDDAAQLHLLLDHSLSFNPSEPNRKQR